LWDGPVAIVNVYNLKSISRRYTTMAFITAETRSSIVELAMGMLNQAPSTAMLETLVAKSVEGASTQDLADYIATTAAFTAEYPSTQTAREFATEMFGKLITGGTLDAEINTAVIDLLEGLLTSGTTKAQGFVAVIDFLANPANAAHADLGDIAQSFQNRADAAEYFSITKELGGSTDAELAAAIASVTSDAATLTAANTAADATASAEAVVAGQAFSLTTGLDTGVSFTGGDNDDTFSAQETSTATTDTLTSGDNLVGGAGTDTLSIAVSGTPAGGITSGVVTSGIEAVKVYNNSTAVYEVDAALMTGLSDVYVSGGTFKTTVDDVDSLANLHLISTNVDAELSTTTAAVAGLADAAIILSNGSASSADVTATYNGLEVINFNAAGTTGAYTLGVTNRTLTLASNQLEKVVVTGDAAANLTVDLTGADLETQTSEFDASAAGGAITAHITKGDSATATVTMSKQADHLDFNGALANTITLDGGDGADTLELDTTLAYSTAAATAGLAQAGAGVSNFEVLYLAAGNGVDERALTNNAGVTTVISLAGGSYTKSTALASITQLSTGTFTTTVATDGTADALTLNLVGAGVSSTLSAANVETLTVASAGLAANTVTMSAAQSADLTSITAAGTEGLTLSISGTSLATVNAAAITGVGSAFSLTASASTADMTVTASANRPTVALTGTANTITTGSGDDTVTGGAYKDVITTNDGDDTITSGDGADNITSGRGADKITAGDGDVTIDSGIGNDTVVVGDGDNTITLGSGNDTLTTGNGDNTITLDAGDDTVTAGSGDDVVVMSDYDDDDVIDLGTGTNVLLADALPTTGAYAAAADFVDISGDVASQLSNVDALYLQHTTADANDSAATKETIDLTSSTGLGALYLDIVDADTDDNSVYDITNFDGSALHLSQTSGESPDVMNIDGTGQASLTVKTYDFNASAGTDLVVTQVDNLTVDTYETVTVSGATSLVTDTALGTVTADGSDAVSVKTDSIAGTLGGIATLTTGNVSADSAQTLSFSAGSNTELVVGAVTSTSNAVNELSLVASDDGVIDLTSVDVSGSDLATLTVTAGIGATIDADGSAANIGITADTIEAATITLGAASSSAFDLLYGGTTTIVMTTGSTLDLEDIGVASTESSTTITGRGTLNGGLDLLGDATLNFAGLTSTGGGLTIDANDDNDAKTITGNNSGNTFITGGGADTVTAGASADVIDTDGDGAKEVQTITVTTAEDATEVVTISILGTTMTFTAAAADDAADNAGDIAATIEASPIADLVTAVSDGTSKVTITYLQSGNVAQATADSADADFAVTAATSSAGVASATGGDDTVTAGGGADTIIAGAGIDAIKLGNDSAVDTVFFVDGQDELTTITGFDVNSDILNFTGIAAMTGAEVALAANAAQNNPTDGGIIIFADGSDGTTAATIDSSADEYEDMTAVAAFLDTSLTIATSETFTVLINDLVGDDVYIYDVTNDGATAAIAATDVTLIGVVSNIGSTALDANDVG
jgi:hypothetical protein